MGMTNAKVFGIYQIQDFTDDSIGVVTGGQKDTVAISVTSRGINTQTQATSFVTPATGLNKITATVSASIILAGDTISIKCVTTSTNDGYYKVSKSETSGYTVEGSFEPKVQKFVPSKKSSTVHVPSLKLKRELLNS